MSYNLLRLKSISLKELWVRKGRRVGCVGGMRRFRSLRLGARALSTGSELRRVIKAATCTVEEATKDSKHEVYSSSRLVRPTWELFAITMLLSEGWWGAAV
jgi:hypothetical protein